MPQILKDKTREVILTAALSVFAQKGYRDTTMQEVARNAGLSTGNLYRYYPDKKTLYMAAVPIQGLDELSAALDRKISGWQYHAGTELRPSDSLFREDLINLLLKNRLYWLVLLREGLGETLVDRLIVFFVKWVSDTDRGIKLNSKRVDTMRILYRNLVGLFRSALLENENTQDLRKSLEECLDYHMGGLHALLAVWGEE